MTHQIDRECSTISTIFKYVTCFGKWLNIKRTEVVTIKLTGLVDSWFLLICSAVSVYHVRSYVGYLFCGSPSLGLRYLLPEINTFKMEWAWWETSLLKHLYLARKNKTACLIKSLINVSKGGRSHPVILFAVFTILTYFFELCYFVPNNDRKCQNANGFGK